MYLCVSSHTLQGPYFAPPYERLPRGVQLVYSGEPVELSEKAEEAAGFFAKMLDHDYTKKDIFCDNFFTDWRKVGVCVWKIYVNVKLCVYIQHTLCCEVL